MNKSIDYLTEAKRRFKSFVEVDASGCWIWCGSLCKGYPVFGYKGRMVRAHKWIWELINDKVPEGKELDHLCNNKPCCNPFHLEAVRHSENMARAAKQGVWAGEKNSQSKYSNIDAVCLKILCRAMMIPATWVARALDIPERSAYHLASQAGWRNAENQFQKLIKREVANVY